MPVFINGEPLPEAAIEYELNRLVQFYSQHIESSEIQRQMDKLRAKAREQAIGAKLLMLESQKMDLVVPESDIDERLETMITNAGGPEKFDAILSRQQLSRELVRENIRAGRKVDLLVERVTSGAPEPTEEAMRTHYDAHIEEYMLPEQAQAQHIMVKLENDTEADRAVAWSRLQEIKARIDEGSCFADEAAAHSDCPSGKASGGSLGWIAKGAMVHQIEDALFAMSDGDVSDVVETPLGLHLLKRTGYEERRPPDYDAVRDKIRDFLRHAYRGEAISTYVQELKEKADITEE